MGEGHPLTQHPTSIVIEFPKPTTVTRLVLVSEIFHDRLALKDFDVYAWAETDWAGANPHARIRGMRDERTVVDFPPFRRMECAPGEEAQVDFGKGALVVSPEGKRRRPHLFRVLLSHSRKGYSEASYRQTTLFDTG